MDLMFEPTDTQAQLRDSLGRWLSERAPFSSRSSWLATPQAIAPLWQGLTQDLGLLGAALPEAVGGLGGGVGEQLVIARALGAALLPEPWLSTAVLGAGLLQRLGGPVAEALLRGVVDGQVRLALAALEPAGRHDGQAVHSRLVDAAGQTVLSGRKTLVRAAPWATHWLVTARDAAGRLRLALVSPGAAGVQRRELPLADGAWAAELAFDGTPVQAVLGEGDITEALGWAQDSTTLATGAEAVGVMERLMADTAEHLRQRRQFGVPLASFQVLQHRLADMHLALVQAAALVGATAEALTGLAPARQRAVAAAQVMVALAARSVGQGAVQLHGGMGMTDELAVGHAFKRLTLIEQQGGPLGHHLRQVAKHADAA